MPLRHVLIYFLPVLKGNNVYHEFESSYFMVGYVANTLFED